MSSSKNLEQKMDKSFMQLEDLPNELWLKLLTYLSFEDKLQLRTVCKRWRDIMMITEFTNQNKIKIDPSNLLAISEYIEKGQGYLIFQNVELYNLPQCEQLECLLRVIGPQLQQLRLKHLPVFYDSKEKLPNLDLICPNTNALPIDIDEQWSTTVVDLNFAQFERLRSFQCEGVCLACNVKQQLLQQLTRQATPHLQLEHLQFEYKREYETMLLQVLTDHAQTLQMIDIFFSATPELPTQCWAQAFEQLIHLKTLRLTGNCPNEILTAILAHLPAAAPLCHMDLAGILSLNCDLLLYLANKWHATLQHLDLMYCVQLDDSCYAALKKLKPHMKSLNVAYCRDLSSSCLLKSLAYEMNYALQELHLEEIFSLDEATLCLMAQRLPNLQNLTLNNCRHAVTNVALACIFQYQTSLRELQVDSCMRISDDALLGFGDCPYPITRLRGLRMLSMRGCRKLSNRTLAALQFNELRALVLGYSHKFSAKGFAQLVENCPALENLCLSSCLMVDDVAVMYIARGLRRLRKLNLSNCFNITERCIDTIALHCDNLEELIVCNIDGLELIEVQQQLHQTIPRLKDVIM